MKTTMATKHKTDRCGTARLDTRRVNVLRIQLLHSAFVGSLTQGGVYLCLFLLLFGDFRCQCVCSLLGCRRFLSLVTFTSSSCCFFFLTNTHKTNVYIHKSYPIAHTKTMKKINTFFCCAKRAASLRAKLA